MKEMSDDGFCSGFKSLRLVRSRDEGERNRSARVGGMAKRRWTRREQVHLSSDVVSSGKEFRSRIRSSQAYPYSPTLQID